jgi:D-amino-acid dehydrogenase
MTTTGKVIVIGAGAVGLCAAHYLRCAGIETTLLERGANEDGCSFQNAGLVAPSHIIPLAAPGVMRKGLQWMLDPESPFYVKPGLDRSLISWVWKFYRSATREHVHRSVRLIRDLCQGGLTLFQELQEMEGMDFGLIRRGLLMLNRTEVGHASCLEEAGLAWDIGMEAEVLDGAGLRELEPGITFRATGGVFYPGDAHLSPFLFMEQMLRLVEKEGAVIRPSSEVIGFERTGRRITGVRTADGLHEADQFVLAGGAWSPTLLPGLDLRLPLQPGKGYSVTVSNLSHKLTLPLILAESHVAVTPFPGSIRFAGTMELAGYDLTINHRRVDAILKAVPRYIADVELPPEREVQPWAGLRPCTPDGLPYVGSFRDYPNLFAATGHAMLGISMAPVTGKIVADLITGRETLMDLTALSPDRFG